MKDADPLLSDIIELAWFAVFVLNEHRDTKDIGGGNWAENCVERLLSRLSEVGREALIHAAEMQERKRAKGGELS